MADDRPTVAAHPQPLEVDASQRLPERAVVAERLGQLLRVGIAAPPRPEADPLLADDAASARGSSSASERSARSMTSTSAFTSESGIRRNCAPTLFIATAL